MLAWYGRDGSFYQYLFTDWRNRYKVNARALNLTEEDKISNIIQSEERQVRLTVENLTLNDELVLRSILVSKLIIRLFKDGTWERLGLNGDSQTFQQSDGRYNLQFNVLLFQIPLPK